MGNFFTNVQIRIGPKSPQEVHNNVLAALRQIAEDEGLQEVTGAVDPTDRAILVGPTDTASWIGVYDQQTEDQDFDKLTELARTLSRRLNTFALAILVHDSDVLLLCLCQKGRAVDTYSGDPDYWKGHGTRKRARPRGHPDRWHDVLVGGATAASLRQAWSDGDVFAEDTLRRIAPLLDLDPTTCCTGFASLYAHQAPPDMEGSAYTILRFRGVNSRRVQPMPSAPAAPPRLESGGISARVECCVGDAFEHELAHATRSAGGASTGLEIWIRGSAVQRDLIHVSALELWAGEKTAVVPVDAIRRRDPGAIVVVLPDFEIPSAPPVGSREDELVTEERRDPNGRPYVASFKRLSKEWAAASVGVRLDGGAARVGSGSLELTLVPTANSAGASSFRFELEVFPSQRRPLRCLPSTPAVSVDLRSMAIPATLSGLVALGADPATCAAVAAGAMADWNAVISEGAAIAYETVICPNHARVIGGTLSSKHIPSGRKWKRIAQDLSDLVNFSAHHGQVVRIEQTLNFNPGSGFSFNAGNVFFEDMPEEIIAYVGFWFDLSSAPANRAQSVQDRLMKILDQLMATAQSIQGFMASWKWSPDNPERTPYEGACGIQGMFTTGRKWSTKYLRAVSEHIWLGPELTAQLGEVTHLAAVADIQQVGNAIRVTRRESASVADMERALSMVLAGKSEWMKVQDAYFQEARRRRLDRSETTRAGD